MGDLKTSMLLFFHNQKLEFRKKKNFQIKLETIEQERTFTAQARSAILREQYRGRNLSTVLANARSCSEPDERKTGLRALPLISKINFHTRIEIDQPFNWLFYRLVVLPLFLNSRGTCGRA
ncbi:hypothetical protein CEXT_313961 [Caerostris extrusa]|uniref:Uncharacterized protein n=1 Tax=Caerostris extrusa TaxID=172846 RepID=A0AAV4PAE1_CAEEX|nr:hypothetical protein CEXT_313961 [Caerostris extrusa]